SYAPAPTGRQSSCRHLHSGGTARKHDLPAIPPPLLPRKSGSRPVHRQPSVASAAASGTTLSTPRTLARLVHMMHVLIGSRVTIQVYDLLCMTRALIGLHSGLDRAP